MNKYQSIIYKTIAILLAWFAWLVPLGLHRIMMRRRYAWLHPLAFVGATLASNVFIYIPENLALGNILTPLGLRTLFDHLSHVWLLSFTFAWMVLVVYDAIAIFSWSVKADHDQAAQ